ncbi:hypothetical protein EMN47_15875 [Prolixibacteraceae bacterium JC049]|nr:hypothetical protein [Prolixibacteraceae bacterium JC049]
MDMRRIQLLLLLIIWVGSAMAQSTAKTGILFSRVGYDLDGDKRVIIRSTAKEFEAGEQFKLLDDNKQLAYSGKLKFWGKKWNSYWWIADFSGITKSGNYFFQVKDKNDKLYESKTIKVARNLLWNKSWETVAIEQLKQRVLFRKNNATKHGPEHAQGGGWQDCGGYLRETNSHATMIIGLFDLLEFSPERIDNVQNKELIEQLLIGLNYLAFCQDKAAELGKGDGAIIHEWPKHRNVITGDVAKGAVCFARASKLLANHDKNIAKEFASRATRAFHFLEKNGPIHNCGGTDFHGTVQPDDGFEPKIHGVAKGFVRPKEWKTRDLVMMTWIAVELGDVDKAYEFAQRVMNRQIKKSNSEGGYFGHFKAYDSVDYTEKAWEHHHMGYDAGATFPHYIIPLIQLAEKFPNHAQNAKLKKAINDFAYGYFLPACTNNPFNLLPMGYYKNEGLLVFSGLWHGMNGAYGSAAALALELVDFTGDKQFKKIATGNLQWIAGLNSGIVSKKGFESKSMIYGIGDEFCGSWTKIPGTICNGFESDRQFFVAQPQLKTDGPNVFTDEGWITHSGGWISALSRLKE